VFIFAFIACSFCTFMKFLCFTLQQLNRSLSTVLNVPITVKCIKGLYS